MDASLPTGWTTRRLRELTAGGVRNLDPSKFADEEFEYFSIPAYQEGVRPQHTFGREILSQKLLVPENCILFGKLNPRVEKVWNVRSKGALRRLASTEWLPIVPTPELDQDFGYFLLRSDWVMPIAQGLTSGSTPSRERVEPKAFYDIEVPLPPMPEQRRIAEVLGRFHSGIRVQDDALDAVQALKRSAMRELFTRGLRGEAQKETEIGPIPASWSIRRLDNCATAVSTRMQYSELEAAGSVEGGVRVLGIKVSDMNAPGNEVSIVAAALERRLSLGDAQRRCAPPLTIVFPKRGAAIATNKKRITSEWTVFDPNVIGVIAMGKLQQNYLFQWFQQFDLRTITEPGPTPQLNKKNLDPLLLPIPSEDEQHEIFAILDAIDRKIALHKEKRAVLEALFKSLLHKLMTGEVRVADLNLDALGCAAEAA